MHTVLSKEYSPFPKLDRMHEELSVSQSDTGLSQGCFAIRFSLPVIHPVLWVLLPWSFESLEGICLLRKDQSCLMQTSFLQKDFFFYAL